MVLFLINFTSFRLSFDPGTIRCGADLKIDNVFFALSSCLPAKVISIFKETDDLL